MVSNMTEKSRENTTENVEMLDTCKQNMLRTIDEVSKYQPQYAQAISNLQQDYLQVTKESINRTFAIQKSWYRNTAKNSFTPIASPYAEQYRKQSDEASSQAFHVFDTANQLAIDSLNASRENIKLYSKTVETVTEYNANMANTWSNYFTSAQKQFVK
jgi:formyltetrahydrofolate synthetase